jgi:hypothetical protein
VTTRSAALVQGGYYVLSGLWPLLSMTTFEAVTGPKSDDWLVHTVGTIIIAIGLTLVTASVKGQVGAPVVLLAISGAAGLAAIEFWYVLRGVIWPIYMLDAVGELGLIVLWAIALYRERTGRAHASTIPGRADPSLIQQIR